MGRLLAGLGTPARERSATSHTAAPAERKEAAPTHPSAASAGPEPEPDGERHGSTPEPAPDGDPSDAPVDNARALVVDDVDEMPPPSGQARGEAALLRHAPFNIGFFGALGALVALFLSQQVLRLSGTLVLLVLAMFLALGLNPAVEWFIRRGIRRGFSLIIVMAAVVGVLTLFVVAIAPVVSDQVATITRNAPGWLDQLMADKRVQDLDQRFDLISKVRDKVQDADFGASLFGGALGVGLRVLSALANTLIVLVLTIYFLASLPSIKQAAYALAPASSRPRVSALGDRIIRSTGAYVAGAFVVAVFAGISTFFFTWIVGLGEYKFALAFVVGILSLVPVVGAFVAGIIMTLLGLTISPKIALVALVYYVAYQQFESYVLYPRIMKRSVDIPGAVTVIAALVGGSLMGVIGALIAVPVAAALLMLHREVFLKRQDAR